MRKLFPYILIILIIVQLLAPFTVGVGVKNSLEIKSNKAAAADIVYYYFLSTKIVEPNIGTQAWSNSFADVVNASGGITTSGKDLCEAAKTPEVMADLEKKGYSAGPCVIVPKEQLGPGGSVKPPEDNTDVECNILRSSTWLGCIGKFLYWALYGPTSHILALAGRLLDITVDYSVKDTSYRSAFVVEGWGVVRDFCNMFFIFILLYIAFGTILKLNGVKTKEMIINVVIIGLLINFSLFATQVIIDASNILARVFYNSQTIVVGPKGKDGVVKGEVGSQGEIKLSEAIMSKTNPHDLILRAKEVGTIQTKYAINDSGDTAVEGQVSGKTFLLVTILAIIINVVGIITFLSCSLIFISRVIGLWLAMIFAPLAFFSYTVPAMQNWDMVGWKKWWPDTLKMAFLAPVFVFFLYLIVKFLETGLGIGINDSKGGLDFLLGIFVPFIFIMILLMKAKDIASKMSGTIGQSITNGIATVGGIALGGAAVGGAFLGRRIIGAGIANISRSDDAMHRATEKIAFNKNLEKWETDKKNGVQNIGDKPTWEKHVKDYEAKGGKEIKGGLFTRLGAKLNEKQMKIGDVDFARSQMDETKKAAGLVDASGNLVDDSNLSGVNEKKMKDTYARTKRSDAESATRKGFDTKGKDVLLEEKDPTTGAVINSYKGEEAFKSAERKNIVNDFSTRTNAFKDGDVDATGKLTDAGKKKVENELNIKLNAVVKIATDEKLANDFNKLRGESKQHVGGAERAFSRTNTGSWDVRNLSNIKTDQREGVFTKIPVAMIAAVAMGVRGGLKSSGLSGGGIKVEGNFMKDLGNTISDSLKGMKVNVNLEHVGETKSSADTHGGSVDHH